MKQLEKCSSLQMPPLEVYSVLSEVLNASIHSMRDWTCMYTPLVVPLVGLLRGSFTGVLRFVSLSICGCSLSPVIGSQDKQVELLPLNPPKDSC